MSRTITKTFRFDNTTAESYFTAEKDILNRDSCLAKLYLNGQSTIYVYMNDAGKSQIFPTSTAKPYRLDNSIRYSRQIGGTAKFNLYWNGTNLFEVSSSSNEYTTTDHTNLTSTAITTSTKSSEIKFYLWQDRAARAARLLWDSMTLYFTQYDAVAVAGTGIASASVDSTTPYDGDTITFTCTLQDGYNFDGWYNGSTKVSSSQTYSMAAADVTLTAKTAVATYTVNAVAGTGIATANVSPSSGIYGTATTYSCTLTSGYYFKGWYEGTTLVSTSQTYNTTITRNCTLTAVGNNSFTWIKLNGAWKRATALWRKENGSWVKLSAPPTLSTNNLKPTYNWILDKRVTTAGGLEDGPGWVTTQFIPIQSNTALTIQGSSFYGGAMAAQYNSDYSFNDYWHASGTELQTFMEIPIITRTLSAENVGSSKYIIINALNKAASFIQVWQNGVCLFNGADYAPPKESKHAWTLNAKLRASDGTDAYKNWIVSDYVSVDYHDDFYVQGSGEPSASIMWNSYKDDKEYRTNMKATGDIMSVVDGTIVYKTGYSYVISHPTFYYFRVNCPWNAWRQCRIWEVDRDDSKTYCIFNGEWFAPVSYQWTYNALLEQSTETSTRDGWIVSDLIPVSPNTELIVQGQTPNDRTIMFNTYNSDKTYYDYWGATGEIITTIGDIPVYKRTLTAAQTGVAYYVRVNALKEAWKYIKIWQNGVCLFDGSEHQID